MPALSPLNEKTHGLPSSGATADVSTPNGETCVARSVPPLS
jgi:hypothetical protein